MTETAKRTTSTALLSTIVMKSKSEEQMEVQETVITIFEKKSPKEKVPEICLPTWNMFTYTASIFSKICRFVSFAKPITWWFWIICEEYLNIDTATANNPFLTVALGGLNAKSNLWFKDDKTTYEGSKIDGITSTFGLQQIINESAHNIGSLIWYLRVRGAFFIKFKLPSAGNMALRKS